MDTHSLEGWKRFGWNRLELKVILPRNLDETAAIQPNGATEPMNSNAHRISRRQFCQTGLVASVVAPLSAGFVALNPEASDLRTTLTRLAALLRRELSLKERSLACRRFREMQLLLGTGLDRAKIVERARADFRRGQCVRVNGVLMSLTEIGFVLLSQRVPEMKLSLTYGESR